MNQGRGAWRQGKVIGLALARCLQCVILHNPPQHLRERGTTLPVCRQNDRVLQENLPREREAKTQTKKKKKNNSGEIEMIQDTVSNSNNNNNKTPTKNSPRRVQLKQKVWLCIGISRGLNAPDGQSYPRPTASWWL